MAALILKNFRALMAKNNINVYVLPRTDEHQNQYLSPSDERVTYLSGFTGSNAIALITQKQALVWTDGRYFLQATKQLRDGWTLKKMIEGQKKWFQHIVQNYEAQKTRIQIDGRLISAQSGMTRKKFFENKKFNINYTNQNLVDTLWQNRPAQTQKQIYIHEKWAGRTLQQKIKWIRNKIQQKKGNGALFTDLGQIAWILNLRSSEIPYNPFFKSTLVVGKQGGTLYLPKSHLSMKDLAVKQHLSKQNISIEQYPPQFEQKLLCQTSKLNYAVYSSLKQPIQWEGIGLYRAVRTEKQLDGFRRCHLSDGIAMAKFWAWRSHKESVNQFVASEYLDELRQKQKNNKGLSFATISGGGPNGAIIHYRATQQNSSLVTKDMIHLVDSGGQYLDGTTDVTRAFHFGTPTIAEKDAYTRVLLGNLDIERMKWPTTVKLNGMEMDILARRHLWKKGLQYMHGTGHGVGYFGSVHQGPVGISKVNKTVLQKNMIVTNQPGYYEPGKFGIRIQNMLIVREVDKNLLGFQNLTLCPYDKNLIDTKLLANQDIEFINSYHLKVWQQISPSLQGDTQSLQWLRKATSPL